MIKNKHSIQKVFLDIDTPTMAMANSIKNNLAMFIQNELVPILEKQFNLIENTDHQIIQIEKLEISIHSNAGKTDIFLSNTEQKNDIKNQIEAAIQKTLIEQKNGAKKGENNLALRTISSHEKEIKTLLYFIENGTMPWWISKEDEVMFFEKISFENFKKDLFKIPFLKLIQQKTIQKRIINQFSNQEIALITSALLDSEIQQKSFSKNILLQFLNNKPHEFKMSFWQLLFDFLTEKKPVSIISFYYKEQPQLSSDKISLKHFIENIKTLVPLDFTYKELIQMKTEYLVSEKEKPIVQSNSDSKKEVNTTKSEISSMEEKLIIKEKSIFEDNSQDDSISFKSCYVQNAGLIILHPFFKEMLKNCDLMDGNIILNKQLAAHIIHYAATKKENDYEHAMLFEKFLCGIPIQQSLQREVKIEEKHKQQVEEMLASVVEHWSALKNTSTDILRTEFIQREGKLDLSESNPKLNIERKTQDLLLEKIPWNINIIKIPWIEKLIYTQW